MKLTIDLESKSRIDLYKRGMHRYAEDPSTDILCFAFKVEGQSPMLWVSDKFFALALAAGVDVADSSEFQDAIDRADIIEAHNLGFEACMWEAIMVKRYGFKPLPKDKLRCSAAVAASYALPRALGQVCEVLGLEEQKDKEGYRIMMKMCKPRKPTKKNPAEWNEDPADFNKLCAYCKQDTVSEEALSNSLIPLPDSEIAVWQLDQAINDRGICVDVEGAVKLVGMVKTKEAELLEEIPRITGGAIKSARQIAASIAWLKERGVSLDNLQKETVKDALKESMPEACRRFLEIRQELGKASVSKLNAIVNMACLDKRLKGSTMYHGASTGRWSAKGVQPHNLPRKSFGEADVNKILELPPDEVELFYGNAFEVASKCVRGMIKAAPDKILFAGDFSAIEARGLAWLANEEKALEAFRDGRDIYKINAVDIFRAKRVRYETVTTEQRQIGKVAELSLGYQGWIGAFESMAPTYGVKVDKDHAEQICLAFRRSRPNTVALWRGLEMAAIRTIHTKRPHAYGRIKFGIRGDFLHMRLPSGRLLSYYKPHLKQAPHPQSGGMKTSIRYMGVDSTTKKWTRQATYGGKLAENATQGLCRDLLAEAMLRTEPEFPIVLHVHDEIVSEVEPSANFERFLRLMAVVPDWAKGLPISVDGWRGRRYRK